MDDQCSFDDAKEFFKELFVPYKRENVRYTSEQVKYLANLEILK